MTTKTVELKIPCETGYEKIAMKMAGELAQKMGFSEERIEDLKTAVAEACINAMEHGNQFDISTKIYVAMTIHDDRLAIDVADEGRGGPPPNTVSSPDLEAQIDGLMMPGGMGLFVIKALVDEADFVEPDLGSGNQFRMVIHLQSGAQEA
ncbi:MAG: ATP-binding protein [bacterium]|nr:ATP-binding protein [bacterium]